MSIFSYCLGTSIQSQNFLDRKDFISSCTWESVEGLSSLQMKMKARVARLEVEMAEVLWPLAEEQEVSKMFEEVEPLMQMLPRSMMAVAVREDRRNRSVEGSRAEKMKLVAEGCRANH